ncbi:tRNA (5-methylaminomethyl-2-thiouridine)(34)-methyltransferase MnmD [Leptospira sp. GIMC2001]|uniref:tRNA (5-methylaminomethyl-2-thiouridine)(34)-methyltransferase MnmD n=1 Tax=Leptospira sp. GIMC2001 TaxID=1513297 RepID=UPI00234A8966|nr:tRNA (5-methylaminomethyl-2-thiouridine)(34)-methyltransferase MnmD [Leptospira sp. GIMC2001]WCL48574.1 tRNA (5-methylaminomethyl-2-thiouridine)(34)-methyltransferase MnmD [Leptospira sp. GIMC2001]
MDAPFSKEFNDVYFSKDGAIAETEYVFLEGNQLQKRFSNPNEWDKHFFTIAETGFGTGLNFLLTTALWNKTSSTNNWLHYISVEGYPLTAKEIRKYLTNIFMNRNDLLDLLDGFLVEYNLLSPGFYRFQFPKYRVSLTILYGDVAETLPELEASVDTWYLDGFSPANNPAMWSQSLFQEIARLSAKGTTLSTYTSASFVRRGLGEVGFKITKQKGFGRKREMSIGIFDAIKFSDDASYKNYRKKYIHNPIIKSKPISKIPKIINIAGAGIAGASVSYALRLRGIPSKIWDPNGIANEASGNPAGIFYPYLTKYPTSHSKFSLQAFYYANQFLKKDVFRNAIISKGLEFKVEDPVKIDRYITSLDSHKLDERVAIKKHSSICFSEGGSISPRDFVLTLIGDSEIIQEKFESDSNTRTEDTESIYCISYKTSSLTRFEDLPLRKVRGQLTILDRKNPVIINAIPEIQNIDKPIASDSYITTTKNNQVLIGSTYDEFKTDRDWSENDEQKIFSEFQKILKIPDSSEFIELKQNRKKQIVNDLKEKKENIIQSELELNLDDRNQLESERKVGNQYLTGNHNKDSIDHELYRISHRCQSKDRLPVVGQIHDKWIYTGLGSRGLVYSMLGGEVLVSILLGEPLPIPRSVYKSIGAERFPNI